MVKKNVFGDMLIGVKLKVSQHTLRYCSILGGNILSKTSHVKISVILKPTVVIENV